MIITISGWSGVGSSALSLLLAKTLKFKLLTGSETFRYLGKKLNYSNTGKGRINADDYLESYWGPIYDNYIRALINDFANSRDLIVESDLGGFLTGSNKDALKIFLIADFETRLQRLSTDARSEDVKFLQERDKILQERYLQLHGINIFDINLLKETHDLVIDNTKISLDQELKLVYERLISINANRNEELTSLIDTAREENDTYWQKGKGWYYEFLSKKNLLIGPSEVFSDVSRLFSKDLAKIPPNIRELILDAAHK